MSSSQNEVGGNEEYYLLPDEEIGSPGEDEFGRKKYAKTLKTIIEKVDPPFNIGLFGPWGSGKSSVVKLLFNRLKEENNEYICVNFDAWKHAEGSVRTELLLQIDELIGDELGESDGILGESDITSQLYDVTEEIQSNLSTLWKNLVKNPPKLILYVTLYTVGFVVAGIAYWYGSLAQSLGIISTIIGISVIKELISYVAKPQIRALNPRKEWSGAYEKIFQSIVNKSLNREGNFEKLIIGIDNLDRCEPEIAYEVLISVKTFMENEDCIFVITCDEEALISHISQKANADEKFGREFLRKMFQTQLRIPKLEAENTEEFIDEQNDTLQVKLPHEVLDVLYKAKIKNPRKIKQILNNIVVLRELAEKLETSEDDEEPEIKRNVVTSNLDFLAKILVLQEFFPSFYQRLEKNKFLLKDLRDYFDLNVDEREQKYEPLHKTLNDPVHATNKSLGATLKSFLRETRVNDVEDLDPFIDLADPSHKDSENISVFQEAIYDSEGFRNDFHPEEIKYIEPYTSVLRKELFECYKNERFEDLKDILISSAKLASDYKEGKTEIYKVVIDRLITLIQQDPEYLTDFPINPLFEILSVNRVDSKEVFVYLARLISSEKAENSFNEEILRAFVSHHESVPNSDVSETISKSISEFFVDHPAPRFDKAIEILQEEEKAVAKYVKPVMFKDYADTLEPDPDAPVPGKIKYFDNYQELDSYLEGDEAVKVRSNMISKMLDLADEFKDEDDRYKKDETDHIFASILALENQINLEAFEKLLSKTARILKDVNNNRLLIPCFHFYKGDKGAPRTKFLIDFIFKIPISSNLDASQDVIDYVTDEMVDELKLTEEVKQYFTQRFAKSVNRINSATEQEMKVYYLGRIYEQMKSEIDPDEDSINELSSKIYKVASPTQKDRMERDDIPSRSAGYLKCLGIIYDDLSGEQTKKWREFIKDLQNSRIKKVQEFGKYMKTITGIEN